MLKLQTDWTCEKDCPSFRQFELRRCYTCARDCYSGQRQGNFSGVPVQSRGSRYSSLHAVSPIDVTLVTTINNKLATVNGELLCGTRIDIMLDSGSSVSLIREEVTRRVQGIRRFHSMNVVNLVTASGDALPILDRSKQRFSFKIWNHRYCMTS